MEGQVLVTGYGERKIELGPVTISIHDRREVEEYVERKEKQIRVETVRLEASRIKLGDDEKYQEAVVVGQRQRTLFWSLFDDFDRSSALASSKTDAEGNFRLSAPDKKDVVLVAVADRNVGDAAPAYWWILPHDEWQEPMLLSNGNQFNLCLDPFPPILSGDPKKVRRHRERNGIRHSWFTR
jgi:hypothetical protein